MTEGTKTDIQAEARRQEYIDNIYLASGSVHPELAASTAANMGIQEGPVERKVFSNGEIYSRFEDNVRGKHIFIIQSLGKSAFGSINDAFMETVTMVDAAIRASVQEITMVAPYLPYSRQDRKARGREPITAAAILRIWESLGVDRVVSMNLHSAQSQASFHGPYDHLTDELLMRSAVGQEIKANPEKFCVVAADGGGSTTAEDWSEYYDIDVEHMKKRRNRKSSSTIKPREEVRGVEGKICVVIEDMIDSGSTLISASRRLKEDGAKEVWNCSTHPIVSGDALETLKDESLDRLYVTNSLRTDELEAALGDKVRVVDMAPLLGNVLMAIATKQSVSRFFRESPGGIELNNR